MSTPLPPIPEVNQQELHDLLEDLFTQARNLPPEPQASWNSARFITENSRKPTLIIKTHSNNPLTNIFAYSSLFKGKARNSLDNYPLKGFPKPRP